MLYSGSYVRLTENIFYLRLDRFQEMRCIFFTGWIISEMLSYPLGQSVITKTRINNRIFFRNTGKF